MHLTCDINHAYKTAPRFFPSLQSAVVELVQNAYRSYWPISPTAESKPRILLDFISDEPTGRFDIRVSDFGCGIDSPERLLSLNSSKWADDVAGDQDPAGLGALAPLAHAKEVEWVSDFGALVVDSNEFFNNPEYREFLQPDPHPAEPRAGDVRTRVTMRGCDPLAWAALRQGAPAQFALYRLASVVVDGHVPPFPVTTFLPVIELPGMRIHTGRRHADNRDLWAPASSREKWEPGFAHTVIWHGHCINVGCAVYDSLPATIPGTVTGLLFERPALSMCIEITAEHLVTPILPDRRILKDDERTRDTIGRAWAAVVEAYEKYLVNLVAHPPTSTREFEDEIIRGPSGVVGWGAYVAEHCTHALFACNRYHFRGCGHTMVRSVLPKDHPKTYSPAAVLLRTPGADTWLDIDTDLPGGLFLDDDASCDPLADAGWYQADEDTATHVCVIDIPEDFPEQGAPVVSSAAAVYMVPRDRVRPDGTIPPTLDIEEFVVLEDVAGTVNTRDISYDNVLQYAKAFGWTRGDLINNYRDLVYNEFDGRGMADDYGEEPLESFDKCTAALCAEWDNKSHIELELHRLERQFGAQGKKLTIDFAAKTVEVDGKVTPVTWSW